VRTFIATAVAVSTLLLGAGAASASSQARYPAAFETSFMRSCNATSGGMTAACRCELRWLERHYSYRQVVTIFLHDKARMLRIVTRAALACG